MRKHYLNTIIGYLVAAFCLCFMLDVSYAGDSDYVDDGNIKAELVWSEFDGENSDDLDMDSGQTLKQDSGDKLYLAFGDSITRGIVRSDGTLVAGYEVKLEALIDANLWPSRVLNAGKSGERTSSGVNRLVQILNTYPLDYVLLLEGTNDILDGVSYKTTLSNLSIMVDYCIYYNVTPIISTLTPLKIDVSSSRGGYIDEIPRYYNPGIKNIASEKGIAVCDQYAALIGKWNKYSDDGIHPNKAGYSVMAQTWYDTISTLPPEPEPEPEPSSGGGGCFIATAAFGSSLEPNVIVLKEFRDKYLMVNEWGKKFVEFYYRTSPLIANIIANNESLKFVVRTCLYPLVGFSYLTLNSSLEQKFFVFGIFTLFVIGIGLFFVRVRLRDLS